MSETIVVVEDDPEILELESFLLESEGYKVITLKDGEHAADTVRKSGAGLMVLDLMLPRKHGNDVLAELGLDASTRDVPVIVVSAYPKQLVRTPQVRGVLGKPFDVTELLDVVAGALQGGNGG